MTRTSLLDDIKSLNESNMVLREHLTQALVFCRALEDLPVKDDEDQADADFRVKFTRFVRRAAAALADTDTAMCAPCSVCGVEIAIVCEECFDEIVSEVGKRTVPA